MAAAWDHLTKQLGLIQPQITAALRSHKTLSTSTSKTAGAIAMDLQKWCKSADRERLSAQQVLRGRLRKQYIPSRPLRLIELTPSKMICDDKHTFPFQCFEFFMFGIKTNNLSHLWLPALPRPKDLRRMFGPSTLFGPTPPPSFWDEAWFWDTPLHLRPPPPSGYPPVDLRPRPDLAAA